MGDAMLLLLSLTGLCALLAVGAWWADRKLDQTRPSALMDYKPRRGFLKDRT